ncbi:MAG: N-acetylglucosamine-6-phosphate deacetylase, partial [Cytophagia bacterium]|nr:N-acetylglucosamine-6-phosphate deacetylase [Cytophagia bacterium]
MQEIRFDKIFTGSEWIRDKSIVIDNGRVKSIVSADGIGTKNGFLCAGFIDLQLYGGGGKLFSNQATTECIRSTFEEHIKTGTVAFQITLNCSPKNTMSQAIQACKNYQGKGLVGLHLEGPFFNPVRRGAHQEAFVQKPDLAFIESLIAEIDGLPTYLTIAPEMFESSVLNRLIESPIMVSIGHSEASFDQAIGAIDKGISRITHLFNAMSQWQSRALGIVGASFSSNAWTSIIVDGQHCDFESVKLAKKLKGDRLFLITDAVTNDVSGPYFFSQTDGRFTNDSGTLSGSNLTMQEAVQNCVEKANISLEEAIRMATIYPA